MTHCHNCMNDTELQAVTDPNGYTFFVCSTCVPLVEEGEAKCSKHAELTSDD